MAVMGSGSIFLMVIAEFYSKSRKGKDHDAQVLMLISVAAKHAFHACTAWEGSQEAPSQTEVTSQSEVPRVQES